MGRGFARTGAQVEEDLKNRVSSADQEYAKQVQLTNTHRHELLGVQRPQAVKALKDLIFECDAALTLQLQKFGSYPQLPDCGALANCCIGSDPEREATFE